MFKHELGIEAEDKVTGIKGIITNRAEALYGCNRYYIQPKVGKDMKPIDGYWVDEDSLIPGKLKIKPVKKEIATGGPMSRIR